MHARQRKLSSWEGFRFVPPSSARWRTSQRSGNAKAGPLRERQEDDDARRRGGRQKRRTVDRTVCFFCCLF